MLADKAEDSEHQVNYTLRFLTHKVVGLIALLSQNHQESKWDGRFKGSAQWDSDVLTGSIAGNTNNGITGHYSEKHVSKSKPRQN